ncbi:SdpI family protein [Macrococcus hajekii]|uniref:SdpI family protein n=1 Tax=Macrococcus hajekii TaxID=198482 RepID=A0A4R6BJ87_9STAP|nr:SdpI family protein [Macrococcus hajekii]TDM01763.1 SdpI family protein [Macrococcus hajekii]GGB07224.1 hypothetical protein GCM10007190_14080 [Macrococcus hajekii]
MILLLTSLFILIFVHLFSKHAVNDHPNMLAGYRSKRSMQSEAHWHFAQQYANRLMKNIAKCLIVIGAILTLLEFWTGYDLWITIIGTFILICGLIYFVVKTENALKRFNP